MKLIKGDKVKIVSGKDKGKEGPVEAVLLSGTKILVTGVNQYKRHLKSRTQNKPSEIVTITKPLAVAAVALLCPKCKKQTRVGYAMEKDKKVRICRKCKERI